MALHTYNVLQIDAWRYDDEWNWNNWFHIGEVSMDDEKATNRSILKLMREEGYLSAYSKGRTTVWSYDGNTIEIRDKNTQKPIFALERTEPW